MEPSARNLEKGRKIMSETCFSFTRSAKDALGVVSVVEVLLALVAQIVSLVFFAMTFGVINGGTHY